MVIAVIVACEIGFWLLLALGLACRYLWKRRTLSNILLISTPVLDLVLLAAAVVDMRSGAPFDLRHGLAAAYIAYSVVFGHQTIRWVDAKVHHRYAGGPPPPPPLTGAARIRAEWIGWARIVLAYAIACGVLVLLGWLAGSSAGIMEFALGLSRVPIIALIWPISHMIWPKKAPVEQ
ncbi:hypothetical protein ACIBG7_40910 [Nonomuraea sp. NPDC050328]|uniref:hypothetical protein n=1 Tax=Nonomuraea sp. NPDC050328 TaxID=3364361 RepID=UPI00378756F1